MLGKHAVSHMPKPTKPVLPLKAVWTTSDILIFFTGVVVFGSYVFQIWMRFTVSGESAG